MNAIVPSCGVIHMDNREFEYILAIAEEKNLSKAAERLFITQPALSLFLTRLEERMQVRLFDRTRKGLVPTYAGEKYLEHIQRVIALEHSFDQELCEICMERKGVLRVGTSPHIGSVILPDVLTAFQKEYPNIEVRITEGTSHDLERLVDGLKVDLALMHLPHHCEHAEYERISDDRYVMVLAGDHPLATKAYRKDGFSRLFIDPKNAEKAQFILARPEQRVRQISDRILAKAGIEPNIRLVTSSVQTALCLSECGLGITFMPESYIPLFNVRKDTLFCYLEDEYEAVWTFSIVYPEGVALSTPARFFLNETKRLFET